MPLGINGYVDPGTYIRQRIQPGSVTVTSERTLSIVGIAPRTKRSSDEAVVRGKVYDESLTFATSTPYIATLINISDRNRNNATLYRNDNALGLGDWSFVSASLVGAEWAGATIDVSSGTGTAQYFTLSVDKKSFVTLDMDALVTGVGGTPATATGANIAAAINAGLVASSVYGSSYSSVASSATGTANPIITLTSPSTDSTSDVKVVMSPTVIADAAQEISNAAWSPTTTAGVAAPTVVRINDILYSATDTYTIDYVAVDILVDALTFATTSTPLSSILFAGPYAGSSGYTQDSDYEKTGNTVDWDVTTWAQATITSLDGVFTATGTDLRIGFNNIDPITVTLTTNLPNPAAADVAADINAAFAASSSYGPLYAFVATVSGSAVVLTAPSQFINTPTSKGISSSIALYEGTTSGVTDIFGIASTSLPYEVNGVGSRPDFGTVYYASYDYTRPSTDYATSHLVYNADQLYEYCSPLTLANYPRNDLVIAGEIAFENSVSKLYITQINDSTSEGYPTPSQVNAAIDVCREKTGITDMVVLDTAEAQAIYLMNHVANMSSIQEKKYRRGWYGMARGTSVGDPDTPDTFVYRSVRTLQPGNTSAGRGRQILVAPGEVSRTLVLEDSTEVTVDLDGSYLATAVAAKFCALAGPSEALLNKTVLGFLSDSTFETYLQGERYTLAGNGVTVVTNEGGNLKLIDPLTTEAGGAKVIEFEEISSSSQKDAVTRAVAAVLDENVRGIVPDDLADFLTDVKTWISIAIKGAITNGDIAPYRNEDGTTRDIDLRTDIQAYQDPSDQRNFIFKYWFNLKYVAKRFFGEYSVDNPFFSA